MKQKNQRDQRQIHNKKSTIALISLGIICIILVLLGYLTMTKWLIITALIIFFIGLSCIVFYDFKDQLD